MRNKFKIILFLSLPLQWLLVQWASRHSQWIESYYSTGIYPYIAKFLQNLFGWIPFSVGDLLYVALGIYLIRWLILLFKKSAKSLKEKLLDLAALLSIIYFVFHFFWGLNYYRLPLHKVLGIEAEYTTEELIETTKKLILNSNLELGNIVEISTVLTQKQIRKETSKAYKSTSHQLTQNIPLKSTKNSLFSLAITYLRYGGYFNPFTGEAQVNAKPTMELYTFISAHEQAHQLGYAAENEANFAAILANSSHEDAYVRFSAYTYALSYCLNEIRRRDKQVYDELRDKVDKRILNMYQSQYEFWKAYDNPMEVISKKVWDNFLKASQQTGGIKSYSYVVALIVNYDQKHSDFLEE